MLILDVISGLRMLVVGLNLFAQVVSVSSWQLLVPPGLVDGNRADASKVGVSDIISSQHGIAHFCHR